MKLGLSPAFAAILLIGCGQADAPSAGPGGVSAEDAQALDEAAAKLDSETAAEAK